MLRTMLDQMLRGKKLTTEQLGEMQAIPGKPSKFAPDMVVQNGIVAQIKQLNFTQIIDITNSVNNMAHGTKLVGLDIVQSIGQSHYYDLNIRVVNFGLPPLNMDLGGGDTKGGPKGRPKGGRPGSGSGGTTGSGGTPKMEGDE